MALKVVEMDVFFILSVPRRKAPEPGVNAKVLGHFRKLLTLVHILPLLPPEHAPKTGEPAKVAFQHRVVHSNRVMHIVLHAGTGLVAVCLVCQRIVMLHKGNFIHGLFILTDQRLPEVGQHLFLCQLFPFPLLPIHFFGFLLRIKAMQILAALHVPVPDRGVNPDLIQHLLCLVDELRRSVLLLCQFKKYLTTVLFQRRFCQEQNFLPKLLRLFAWSDRVQRIQQVCGIAVRRPFRSLAALLPKLELCLIFLHTQRPESVVRHADLPDEAKSGLQLPNHALIREFVSEE